ncbi:MAG: hypothetical protein AVDCRST_MAG73-4091 [uncultured Thermomicrobiales bacterium]|uniref:Uncharacterized protein n=1 Tax=uncultured Thermomicrobiales bacterium TaxID=1645740 RepID=A0A6J4V2X0_9BACT|nr:MAG: hypothetical protein AVDCRST_MAG73-4091 [uncultured Thermomicrobiales bacterium]
MHRRHAERRRPSFGGVLVTTLADPVGNPSTPLTRTMHATRIVAESPVTPAADAPCRVTRLFGRCCARASR